MDYGTRVDWTTFKNYLDNGWVFQEIILPGSVRLIVTNGEIKLNTVIHTDGAMPTEYAEYQATYESNKNKTPDAKDNEGARLVRMKAAQAGWTYNAFPMEFRTSELNSLVCHNLDGSPKAGVSLTFYDGNDNEITEEGLLEINETGIVKTVITFEPPYDYEVIGGHLAINQEVGDINDCRLWIIAVPDIPAPTGSKEMASGINMKFLNHQTRFEVDGRVAKYMTYNATYHTNKLQFIFVHTAGLKRDVQIVVEHYKA